VTLDDRIERILEGAVEAYAYGRNDDFALAVDAYQRHAGVTWDEAYERCVGAFHALTGGSLVSGRRW